MLQHALTEEQSEDPFEPPGLTEEDVLEWVFLLDALNFCFWSDEETKFTVKYGGKKWTGYRALCAGLSRAVQVSFNVELVGSLYLWLFIGRERNVVGLNNLYKLYSLVSTVPLQSISL